MIDISVSFLTKAFALSIPIGVVFCAVTFLAYMWVLKNENGDGRPSGAGGRSSGGRSSGAGGRSSGGRSSGAGGRSSGGRSSAGGRSSGGGRSSAGGGDLGGLVKALGEGIGHAGRGVGETLKGAGALIKGTGEGAGALVKGTGDGAGKLFGGAGSLVKGTGEGSGALVKGTGDGAGKLLGGVGSLASGLTKPLKAVGNGIARTTKATRDEIVQDVAWGWNAYSGRRHGVGQKQTHHNEPNEQEPDELPRNVFNAGTQDDAETIRDLCKACNIEADIDGSHVAINPNKLVHAQQVLAMAGYNVTFPSSEDENDDIVLDYDEETGEWALNESGQTWRDTYEDVKGQVLNWWDPALYPADQAQQAQQAQQAEQAEKTEATV